MQLIVDYYLINLRGVKIHTCIFDCIVGTGFVPLISDLFKGQLYIPKNVNMYGKVILTILILKLHQMRSQLGL